MLSAPVIVRKDYRLSSEVNLTPHAAQAWAPLLSLLEGTSAEQLERWQHELQRRLKDNGATYRDMPHTHQDRDWSMDPVPMVLSSTEWQHLESGVLQRAQAIETLLSDLMGPQRQVRDGRYDPKLLFSDPDYLMAAHDGVGPDQWLNVLAFDVARDADGRWRVYADISRPPAGLGYVLERRMIMARVFGFLTRQMPMRRLVGFFADFRAEIDRAVVGDGHAVMLTPGQHHPSYFEHAFLANFLDLTLAQGDDLAVRDGSLWLKTLDGLQPVSLVLRRVMDSFVDPLNFREDSRLGTPGLSAVIRAGKVAVWNAPGAGLLDSPGFMSQLDQLQNEPLILPSAETLSLANPAQAQRALARPEQFVFRALGSAGREGLLLSPGDSVLDEIRRQSDQWVAQARLSGSRIPAVHAQGLEQVNATIRLYAVKTQQGWQAMPGGLARFTRGDVAQLQASGRSVDGVKDLWVMGESFEEAGQLQSPTVKPQAIDTGPGSIPSRVADSLYWVGRYAERLDFVGRLLREVLLRMLEQRQSSMSDPGIGIMPLLFQGIALGSRRVNEDDPEAQLETILTHADHPVGLHRALSGLLENARAVPDYLSSDVWRLLVRLEKSTQSSIGLSGLPISQQIDRADQILMLLSATNGLLNDTMSRTLGFRFLDIGRHLERALQTCALIREAAQTSRRHETSFWEMVLGVTDTRMTYKRRYRAALHPGAVVDMLMLEDSTPRSLAYQLRRLVETIERLPGSARRGALSPHQRMSLEARTALQLAEPAALMTADGQSKPELIELLSATEQRLLSLSETLTLAYFNHADVPHQFTRAQS